MRNRVHGMKPNRRISGRAPLSLALLCVLCLTIWAGAPLDAAQTSDEDSRHPGRPRPGRVSTCGVRRAHLANTDTRGERSGHDGLNRVTCPQQNG
jgi:hypothetical protein